LGYNAIEHQVAANIAIYLGTAYHARRAGIMFGTTSSLQMSLKR
jgi:hypothetical protein